MSTAFSLTKEGLTFSGDQEVANLMGLPAGQFIVTAKVQIQGDDALDVVACRLEVGMEADNRDVATVQFSGSGVHTLPLLVPADLPSGGHAMLRCDVGAALSVRASWIKITAIQIDNLMREFQ